MAELHAQIDLASHGIIEASAGTGKTYTLENLAVRLLEQGTPLEQILVLTYTEAATSELLKRIRQMLQAALTDCQDAARRAHLQAALDGYEGAAVFTIHGFCHRVLRRHAFENGEAFDLEVVPDEPLYERLLHARQRAVWPALASGDKANERLAEFFKISGYPGYDWDKQVLALARAIRICPGPDKLRPEEPAPFNLDCFEAQPEARGILDRLSNLVGKLDGRDLMRSEFAGQYEALKAVKSAARSSTLAWLLRLLQRHAQRPLQMSELVALCEEINSEALTGFMPTRFLKEVKSPPETHIKNTCPNLPGVAQALQQLAACVGAARKQLAAATVRGIKVDAGAYKRERGQLSFEDMLLRLDRALCSPRAPELLAVLRREYAYALVDEFQDTDAIQWSILRRIFVGERSENAAQKIFLIGDPKQAIYGFRGADVKVYQTAKEELAARGGKFYKLEANWRSIPELSAGLDKLFKHGPERDGWFAAKRSGIAAGDTFSAPELKTKIIADGSGRPALNLVDLGEAGAASAARAAMVKFIAAEIAALRTAGIKFLDKKGRERKLELDGICVLVSRHHEAPEVEEALDAHGIPHSFYKKPGLYRCEEAAHLSYLFTAIARPGDQAALFKALLTRFFRVDLAALPAYAALPPEHPIQRLLAEWRAAAQKRHWARFFQSLLEDTGILWNDDRADRERRATNCQHILEELELEAQRAHLDFTGIHETLNRYRSQAVEVAEERDLHRRETEEPKVQIMTIHAAKGLEFPIVFLAGGFASSKKSAWLKYHERAGEEVLPTVVYDLAGDDEARNWHKQEEDDEQRRLYYVALTRAQLKLYAPFLPPAGNSRSAGAAREIIYPSALGAWPDSSERKKIVAGCEPFKESSLDSNAGHRRLVRPGEETRSQAAKDVSLEPAADILADVSQYRAQLAVADTQRSFSSLKKFKRSPARFGDAPDLRDDDEPETAWLAEAAANAGQLLPRGKVTGWVLHEVLQHADYDAVRRAKEWPELLADATFLGVAAAARAHFGMRDGPGSGEKSLGPYTREIARLVWNSLHAPLAGATGKEFALGELGPAGRERIHELRFCYPLPQRREIGAAGPWKRKLEAAWRLQLLEEIEHKSGYLAGAIDLVFRRRESGVDFYCLVDWKSNTLSSYDLPALKECMTADRYDLQYHLYTLALARWLEQCGVEFKTHFGGVFYFFLRGVDPATPGPGIFHDPSVPDPAKLEEELFVRLNAASCHL
jgi:exodeoxyribonuclease V beta subunit